MRPKIGVCLCVRKGHEVLLHKRKAKHAHGFWAFPGGHLEMWEEWGECALRELAEEAGPVKVTKPKLWKVINTMYKDEGKHYVTIIMVCNYVSGKPVIMEPEKNEGWGWYDWQNMPKPLMLGIQKLVDDDDSPWDML